MHLHFGNDVIPLVLNEDPNFATFPYVMAYCENVAALYHQYPFPVYVYSIKCMFVTCTICLCLQSPVSRHSLNVTVENVSQAPTAVLVLIHAKMAVMKMDAVST